MRVHNKNQTTATTGNNNNCNTENGKSMLKEWISGY